MKIKTSAVAILLATGLFVTLGPVQAACVKQPPGWHMVSKRCNVPAAQNWQQYNSGYTVQPTTNNQGLPFVSLSLGQ